MTESARGPGRPTLRSVAERARVSRQTVSNAINSPHLVRADTLRRVRQMIDEVGYRPHRGARALRTRRSNLIGLRIDPLGEGLGGAVLDRFLHAFTQAADQSGYRVLLFTANDDGAEIEAYAELLSTHDLDGLMLTRTHAGDQRTEWLSRRGVPFVTFGRPWTDHARHAWVDVDGAAGTAALTCDLLAGGHRRIAFVGWPPGSGVGDDRRDGWAREMAAAGVPLAGLSVDRIDGVEQGREAAQQLFGADPAPTAVLCVSDPLALGVLGYLRTIGRTPGPALPVVGFDDTPGALAAGLSSLAQPLVAAAETCLRLLLDQLDGGHMPAAGSVQVLLRPRLVVRDTGGVRPPATTGSSLESGEDGRQ